MGVPRVASRIPSAFPQVSFARRLMMPVPQSLKRSRVSPQLVIGMGDVVGEPLSRFERLLQVHVVGGIRIQELFVVEHLHLVPVVGKRAVVRGHGAAEFV